MRGVGREGREGGREDEGGGRLGGAGASDSSE